MISYHQYTTLKNDKKFSLTLTNWSLGINILTEGACEKQLFLQLI